MNTVNESDAPPGCIAVSPKQFADGAGSCAGCCYDAGNDRCMLASSVWYSPCWAEGREDEKDVIFKKIPVDVPPLASKKLTIHSNNGNILLCFDGFDLPCISVMNYGDISAQEVAERLLTCWNKHVHESVEAIEEGSK